ncbi:MAG: adenosine monophosphate-protein transferase [Candidatus Aegiribacteria sp.]|nr:adenosine monophosphate-protein transferase [Candidatus Aegiribacteria sp.]MBD3293874.1 adenosine monophosphate-protein transferase [Candidatus Fermentibacteria bacterium]
MDLSAIEVVDLDFPEGCNIVLGQSHFIKTVEDLYEAIVGTVPEAEFGLAFSEASGPRLVRSDGTSLELKETAEKNLLRLGCGHVFLVVLNGVFPIQILNSIKNVQEVCRIYCATANPVQVMVGRSRQGGGVMGVIDGEPPLAVEIEEDVENRIELLKRIGYKR